MSSRVEPRAVELGTVDEAFRGPKGGPQWNIAGWVAIRALGLKLHHLVPIFTALALHGDAVGIADP
jgi:hypothetical protein